MTMLATVKPLLPARAVHTSVRKNYTKQVYKLNTLKRLLFSGWHYLRLLIFVLTIMQHSNRTI